MVWEVAKMILAIINLIAQIVILISVIQLHFLNAGHEEGSIKTAIATCPSCGTTVIEDYFLIKPRMWTCTRCGIKVKYKKS